MKVLYFGSYKPSYPRNKIFIEGLRRNGIQVVECNDRSRSFLKYVRLAYNFLKLVRDCDIVLVGFPGQEMMFLARFLSRKPLVFDVFTSHYMGYILDRRYFPEKSWRAAYYRFVDTWSCRLADCVILDTQAHIDFFVKEFGLPPQKFKRIFLGANTELHHPRPQNAVNRFSVVFWGNFIPLQGTEYILRAAKILEQEPIVFSMIGHGQMYDQALTLAQELDLKNVIFTGKISDEELTERIRVADVCLGAFSAGIKANITIQNKIFETLASKRALLTARTTAVQEFLTDERDVLLCRKADPKDLAEKILMLKQDLNLRDRIAEAGYQLFREKLTEEKLGKELITILHGLIA